MKNGSKALAILMLSLSLGAAGVRLVRTPQVHRLARAYRAAKNTNAPLNFWERLVVTFALSRNCPIDTRPAGHI